MELAYLRTLVHVAELGSLSKAADRLRIAQPALSRQVRLLEGELGIRLFVRHGRGMVITEQGREVLKHAVRVLAEIDEIQLAASNTHAPLIGQVAIGLPPTIADIISLPLVTALGNTPEISLRLVAAYTGYLLDWLQRGEIDVAVLYDPGPAWSVRSRPLLLEKLFLIGPQSADFTPMRPVSFKKLDGRRLLLPSVRHGLRMIVDRCAAEAKVRLDIAVETDSYTTLKNLVRHGHGWTILPLAPIHDDLNAGWLTAAPLIDPEPTRQLVLAYPADRPPSRLARHAGDAIFSIITDEVKSEAGADQLS